MKKLTTLGFTIYDFRFTNELFNNQEFVINKNRHYYSYQSNILS